MKLGVPLFDVGELVEEFSVLLLDKLKLTLHGVGRVERLDRVGLGCQLLVVEEVGVAELSLPPAAVGDLYYLLEEALVLLVYLVFLAYKFYFKVRTFLVARVELRGFECGLLVGVAGGEDAGGRGVLSPLPGSLLGGVDGSRGGVGGRRLVREELL